MKRYDEAVFWACVTVLLLLGFAGGAITVAGVVYIFIK